MNELTTKLRELRKYHDGTYYPDTDNDVERIDECIRLAEQDGWQQWVSDCHGVPMFDLYLSGGPDGPQCSDCGRFCTPVPRATDTKPREAVPAKQDRTTVSGAVAGSERSEEAPNEQQRSPTS